MLLLKRRLLSLNRRAFSLTEVLVVIAVVAVLAALIFQIIGMARMAGYQAVNLSNLRTLGVGTLNYAADHDGQTPPQMQRDSDQGNSFQLMSGTGTYRSSRTVPTHMPRDGYVLIDNYYTPLSALYPDRKPGQWASRINIFYTYFPRNPTFTGHRPGDENRRGVPTIDEQYNCSVHESPRALLYFNPAHPVHVNTLQYDYHLVSAVYLDASVRTFPIRDVQAYIADGGNQLLYFIENK